MECLCCNGKSVEKKIDLNERSLSLLKNLVERYIKEGQPVGSRVLSKDSNINLSPATIRNVMADLDGLGLIHSPHTSAGRVPTVKGYRFFVDSILENNFFKVYGRATRNLISVEDVYNIADNFIVNKMATNKIINIATPFNTPVHKIVLILEKLLNKRAKYEVLDLGVEQTIDISYIVSSLKIKFDENYVEDILKKYLIKRGLM